MAGSKICGAWRIHLFTVHHHSYHLFHTCGLSRKHSFISPAVVAPEVVDIEVPKDDGGTMRRGLMVIAKVIQNLANNIFFGKEAHMVPLNEFLGDHIVKVTRFLNDIVVSMIV